MRVPFDRPLARVATLVLFALPAAGQNLVAHYRLDEASGSLVSDSSGNGLDGQTQNGTSWVPGWIGGGLELDGFGGHVRIPHDPLHDVAELTIAAFVHVDVLGDWDGILTKGTNAGPYALQLGFPIGKFKFTANWGSSGGTGGGSYTSAQDVPTGEWHHLAVTFDGDDVLLYLDGALDSTHPTPGMVLGAVSEEMTLGCDFPGGDEYFDGVLDDVRLYDGALSPSEIADLAAGSPVGLPYCFGDGSGSPCPCGNTGGVDEGCLNSTGAGAAQGAFGSNSAGVDDLFVATERLVAGQPALLFVGQNAVNGGNGAVFGDGLRCAGGTVIRLGIEVPDANGGASWGPGLRAAGGWNSGDVRRFQTWYRDPSGPCGTGFNLSNGTEVTFAP